MRYFLSMLSVGALLAAGAVFAQTDTPEQGAPQNAGPKISFPIAELGGCADKAACKTYCDAPANAEACINFAESKGMMKADEAATARKFATKTGPGGCKGSECRMYCNDKSHFAECQKFAEDNGMPMPKGPPQGPQGPKGPKGPRVDEGKAESVLAQKAGPGGCTTKDACKTYCDDPDHSTECVKFAEDNGLMTKEDAQLARKLMGQAGPGGCKGENACNQYCSDDSHMEECLSFAEKNGLMDPQELQQAKNFVQKGGPGGCKGRDACDAFCSDPANQETCINFAVDNGMMNADEAAKIKEMMKNGPGGQPGQEGEDRGFGGFFSGPDGQGEHGGPGGCKSKEECDQYCKDHPDECKGGPGGPGKPGGPGFGPCKSPEECKALCDAHPGQCEGESGNMHPIFRPEMGGEGPTIGPSSKEYQDSFGPKQTGPGGCRSEAECEAYCASHRRECGAPEPGVHTEGPPPGFNTGPGTGNGSEGIGGPPPMGPSQNRPGGPEGFVPPMPQEGQNFQGMMQGQGGNFQGPPQSGGAPQGGFQGPPPGGEFQGPPPGGEAGGVPPGPSSEVPSEPVTGPTSSNLVAAVYSLFAHLLGYR